MAEETADLILAVKILTETDLTTDLEAFSKNITQKLMER